MAKKYRHGLESLRELTVIDMMFYHVGWCKGWDLVIGLSYVILKIPISFSLANDIFCINFLSLHMDYYFC